VAHSPHRQWKGCPLCKPNKDRRRSDADRAPWQTLRKTGKLRRYSRRDLGD
jgi:hypothetical protein